MHQAIRLSLWNRLTASLFLPNVFGNHRPATMRDQPSDNYSSSVPRRAFRRLQVWQVRVHCLVSCLVANYPLSPVSRTAICALTRSSLLRSCFTSGCRSVEIARKLANRDCSSPTCCRRTMICSAFRCTFAIMSIALLRIQIVFATSPSTGLSRSTLSQLVFSSTTRP